jgi:hypothetical protein
LGILVLVGAVAYQLEPPEKLSDIHPSFNVSPLQKYLANEDAHVPLDEIEVDERLESGCLGKKG